MWKRLNGISLTLCLCAMAEGTAPKSFVQVQCCGRLRHGVMAIGGESTGTTIAFNRIIWELQLPDEAAREFAKEHHKKPVVVTGTLRKVAGVEKTVRWIVDVQAMKESDTTKDTEGTRLRIQGTLQAPHPQQDESPGMTIVTTDHAWPLDLTSNAILQSSADALVGQSVLLTGHLEQKPRKESDVAPIFIRVRTLKQPECGPRPGRRH